MDLPLRRILPIQLIRDLSKFKAFQRIILRQAQNDRGILIRLLIHQKNALLKI